MSENRIEATGIREGNGVKEDAATDLQAAAEKANPLRVMLTESDFRKWSRLHSRRASNARMKQVTLETYDRLVVEDAAIVSEAVELERDLGIGEGRWVLTDERRRIFEKKE